MRSRRILLTKVSGFEKNKFPSVRQKPLHVKIISPSTQLLNNEEKNNENNLEACFALKTV